MSRYFSGLIDDNLPLSVGCGLLLDGRNQISLATTKVQPPISVSTPLTLTNGRTIGLSLSTLVNATDPATKSYVDGLVVTAGGGLTKSGNALNLNSTLTLTSLTSGTITGNTSVSSPLHICTGG